MNNPPSMETHAGGNFSARENDAHGRFIREGDFESRKDLNSERVKDMRQARRLCRANHRQMRNIRYCVYKCLMLPLAFLSGLMTLGLGLAVYFPGLWKLFCLPSPLLSHLGKEGNGWPLAAFILGTFISFAAVFGALAFGVFASVRDRDNPNSSPAQSVLNMISKDDMNSG